MRDGDLALWESNSIIRYLASCYNEAHLYPAVAVQLDEAYANTECAIACHRHIRSVKAIFPCGYSGGLVREPLVRHTLRASPFPGSIRPQRFHLKTRRSCPKEPGHLFRIRNYDPERLRSFWDEYRRDTTYNLTHRNCSSTVARALEAALQGLVARAWTHLDGWWPLFRLVLTPELWVAAHLRKRAVTMAWTPGSDARLCACNEHAGRPARLCVGRGVDRADDAAVGKGINAR